MASILRKVRSKLLGTKLFGLCSPAAHPPSSAWPLQDAFPPPPMSHQEQSPLFAQLCIEIRLLIYEAVLGDPQRYMHIRSNIRHRRKQKKQKRPERTVAHFRCTDMESPFPTWQHKCFGEEWRVDPGRWSGVAIARTETDDKLLALLLTCRLIYSEALEVLYRSNIFHFRGGVGLPAFVESIPTLQWMAIRHIHISTAYSPFFTDDYATLKEKHPPESLPSWATICRHLEQLPALHSLKFDIAVKDHQCTYSFSLNRKKLLLSILGPLRSINAQTLEVELNAEVPDEIWELLGPVKLTTFVRERPFNDEVYKNYIVDDSERFPIEEFDGFRY
ncbi:hypothetical protein P154DRAFT_522939 [Amniculicola lignicola CBS 123094]|uniref:DUF7730 domain-containing protein n=1 Tax=Amniculicola lignicola CBS 123094 TaxID=1392246 RepID=A0A6A5WQI8_9PLEO|nr:hypothetical protein P154DRAFT_522939 [Amniculicola lignicola CBS 123094]